MSKPCINCETSDTEFGPGLSADVSKDGPELYIVLPHYHRPYSRNGSVSAADVFLRCGVNADDVAFVDEQWHLQGETGFGGGRFGRATLGVAS